MKKYSVYNRFYMIKVLLVLLNVNTVPSVNNNLNIEDEYKEITLENYPSQHQNYQKKILKLLNIINSTVYKENEKNKILIEEWLLLNYVTKTNIIITNILITIFSIFIGILEDKKNIINVLKEEYIFYGLYLILNTLIFSFIFFQNYEFNIRNIIFFIITTAIYLIIINYIKLVISKNKETDSIIGTSQGIFFIIYMSFWKILSNDFINKKILPFFRNFKEDIKIKNNKYYIKKTRFYEFNEKFVDNILCPKYHYINY